MKQACAFSFALALVCFADRVYSQIPASPPQRCSLVNATNIARGEQDYPFGAKFISAVGDEALLTYSRDYSGSHDGVGDTASVWINASFPRGTVSQPYTNSAAGCALPVLLVATRLGTQLTRFAYGFDREAGSSGDRHFRLADRSMRGPSDARWHAPDVLAAAGNETLVLGLSAGREMRCEDPCDCSGDAYRGSSLRSFVFRDGRARSSILARETPDTRQEFRALSVAVGPEFGVALWRDRNQLRYLRVALDGTAVGSPLLLAQGEVGTPAIAFRGRTLIALWAQRGTTGAGDAGTSNRYTLRFAEWNPAVDTPVAREQTGFPDEALAPSIATEGNRVLIAWTEGDTERRGALRVTLTDGALAPALASAVLLSFPSGNARDPEVALTPSRAWLTWEEYGRGHPRGSIMLSTLQCQ